MPSSLSYSTLTPRGMDIQKTQYNNNNKTGLSFILFLLLASALISTSFGDTDKDEQECAEQLAGLAICLPYVQGQAKAPTPDCCSGLKQVLKQNKKCLCVIIKDRNDPDLGLQINVTLALSLPSVCNAPANVSKCPALLHMDPKSPEAQVFYQLGKSSSNGDNGSPASSPTEVGSPTSGASEGKGSQATTGAEKNYAYAWHSRKRLFGLDYLVGVLLLWSFMG